MTAELIGQTLGQPIVASMEQGMTYRYNFAGSPAGTGTFEGWTDFGWMVFTDTEDTRFFNPALLATLRPESYDSILPGTWQK